MSTTAVQARENALADTVIHGVTAGLVGGALFGVQMAAMGMLPMVGGLVGTSNPVIGFVVHLLISAFIGATYGLIAEQLPLRSWPAALGAGTLYGIVWWVLGALLLMPLMLGMGEMVFQVGEPQLMSLVGHVAFGIVLGSVYRLVTAE